MAGELCRRGPCSGSFWLLEHQGVTLALITILVMIGLLIWWLGRRQERNRRRTRYEFDERGRMKRIPPPDGRNQ